MHSPCITGFRQAVEASPEVGEKITIKWRGYEKTFEVHETWVNDAREDVAELWPVSGWKKERNPRRTKKKKKR